MFLNILKLFWGYEMRSFNLFIKRAVDIFGSIIGLIVLSPLIIIISILIKLTSPGPVFFTQERLGKNGQHFRIIKFRTMIVDAEKSGLHIDTENDPRITKIGGILRRFSLDEIPQLLNVISGSMSFVGPRPPVTYFPYEEYKNYPDWAKKRFEMRPGITGLAQVTVRNSVPWDDRIELDNKYISNFSVLLDLKVLIQTAVKVFKADDIYDEYIETTDEVELVSE